MWLMNQKQCQLFVYFLRSELYYIIRWIVKNTPILEMMIGQVTTMRLFEMFISQMWAL